MDVRDGLSRKLSAKVLMLLSCGVGEDSWESLGLQGDQISQSKRKSTLNIHWKDWCWSWSSNSLATWCEELTHWERPWCWERLKAGREGMTEDEVVGWHHQLDGHEFEQAPGVGDGHGSLVYHNPWGCKESDMTEWLNWTEFPWQTLSPLEAVMGFIIGQSGHLSKCIVFSGGSAMFEGDLGI